MDNIQKPIEWQNEDNDTLDFDYKATEPGHAIIKVVGVGGGGSNAVRHMYQEGIQDVSFLIINTDFQALKGSPIPNKLQISDKGLGAGADPEVARKFALQYEDQIRTALSDGTEMVFITAGMGGGTGTGAAPIVARIAHDMNILTVGIVTIPFEFEGRDKILMALQGVKAIKEHVDALLVVNNNRLIDIYPDFNFFNAFKKADDTLTIAAKSISDIINIEGYMNLDFADVSTTLRNGGVALISTGSADGENRVTKAIEEAITSPLLQDNDIKNAKHLLFEICFSESNPVAMSEIAEVNKFVKNLNTDIKVIWGAMVDNSLGDSVKFIILASGFDMDQNGDIRPDAERINRSVTDNESESQIIPADEEEHNANFEGDGEKDDNDEEDGPAILTGPVTEPVEIEQPAIKVEPEKPAQPVIVPVHEQKETTKDTDTQLVEPKKPVSQPVQPIQPQQPVKPVQQPVQPIQPQQPVKPVQQPVQPIQPQQPVKPVQQPVQPVQPQQPVKPVQPKPVSPSGPTPATTVMEGINEIRKYYGEELANETNLDMARKAYYILDNEELSNEELVDLIEQLPSYNRSVEELGELKAKFKQ